MKIRNISGRELTETEKKTAEVFETATEGGMDFALIGERAVMVIPAGTSEDEAEDAVKGLMEAYLCQSPDFTPFVLKDGWCAVALLRYCFAVERLSDGEKGDVSFGHALEMRQICLDACRRGEIIAFCMADR